MTCPNCHAEATQATFEGPEVWCARCGTLTWVRADGSMRPRIPILTQQATTAELNAAARAQPEGACR